VTTDEAPTGGRGLAELVDDIARLEAIFARWDEAQRAAVAAYKRAIEALHAEALRRLVRACKAEPLALAALRAAVGDEVVYAVMRQLELLRPSLDERIAVALESVRPMLASHGGDVELVRVASPRIEVRFLGACDGCASSAVTFHAGIREAVQDACPEITEVVEVPGAGGPPASRDALVSPFALVQRRPWRHACELAELGDGTVRALAIDSCRVLLARRGDAVSCFMNSCAHLGLPLDDGSLEAGVLTCRHHGFRYDLSTGECLTAPAVALETLPVRVVAGRIEVRLAS